MTRQQGSSGALPVALRRRRRGGPGWAGRAGRADARLLHHAVGAGTPTTDRLFAGLSQAANHSVLWWGVAALLAGTSGARGRRAAAGGLLAVGVVSALVNAPLKFLYRRPRPVIGTRPLVVMPGSFSFPSGHAASAFAFATAAGLGLPEAAAPLAGLAAAVAYSRIHTGVHYPSDVLAGAGIGMLTGVAAHRVLNRYHSSSAPENVRDDRIPRRAVLVTSGHAGSANQLDRARQAMLDAGIDIVAEIPVARAADRLPSWVEGERPLLVVAAGGDGTVGAVADAVIETEAVLAVLPLGTSNDVARSLGLPVDPVAAARLLTEGKVASIDAGRLMIDGQPAQHFVHAATIGLNVEFAKLATQPSLRRRFGRLTYVVAALTSLPGYRPFEVTLSYDGQERRMSLMHLSVINAPVFGGALELRMAGSSVDDRVLDVIAVEHTSPLRLLVAAVRMFAGRSGETHGVLRLRLRRFGVHAEPGLRVALDGEVCADLPACFEVAGNALRVVTPWDFVDVDD